MEYFGILPSFAAFNRSPLPFANQITQLFATNALLFVVAFISAYTAQILKRNKKRLYEQNIELGKASKAKSDFLANMSHELRTPLNHIIGFTELVLDRAFGDLNQTQAEYLNDVHNSSKHLLSLINDILDLSKIEAGKLEFKPSLVKIRDILENSLVMIREKTLKHGIKITTDLDGIPESINADERKLKQILYNLLSNAVKFTPENGSILLAAKHICNSDKHSQGLSNSATSYLQISVEDSGVGIKKTDLEKIFEPFEQAESSASGRFQGTGLGLSLTKSLVKLHEGKIWAESGGEGKGASFIFCIPVTG
jgi:signal transduction histidine kinase